MTMVEPLAGAHRVGAPVYLSAEDIAAERASIESRYGDRDHLVFLRNLIGLSLEQSRALQRLEDLDFLGGGR